MVMPFVGISDGRRNWGVEARRRGVRQHRAAEDQGQVIAVTEADGTEACDTLPVESVAVTVKL